MPSKRHGYLTRKEWLRERLEDARDRAGAFDVERLLRATRFYYTKFDYRIHEVERGPICYTDDGRKRMVEALRTNIGEQMTPPEWWRASIANTMAQAERDGLVRRATTESPQFGQPSRHYAPHVDCDCTSCRPWTS